MTTAANVRNFFNADPKRLDALSPAARHTVEVVEGKSPRGRIHPEAVALHNRRKPKAKYVVAVSEGTQARAKAKADAAALRAKARKAGFEVKDRGRLPKAFTDTLKPQA